MLNTPASSSKRVQPPTFRGPPLDFTKIKKKLPKNYVLDSNSNIILKTTPHSKLGLDRQRASSMGSSTGSSGSTRSYKKYKSTRKP